MKRTITSLALLPFLLVLVLGMQPLPAQAALQGTPVVSIMQIQGSEQYSPYAGQVVETSGVVTLYTANGAHFWMQDPKGDGKISTSDGIFVSGGGSPASGPKPQVGDKIRIVAQVQEQQFGNALPLTRLRNVQLIEVKKSGQPLPKAVKLTDLPNWSIADGIKFWERLEGMRVEVAMATVIAPTNEFNEFGVLAMSDIIPGSGYYHQNSQILVQYYSKIRRVDYNPERIMVDDSAAETPIVRPGDRIRKLTGVVDYTFSNYKIQLDTLEGLYTRRAPAAPVSKRSGMPGNLTITTFNVNNLFDLIDNPDKNDTGSSGGAATQEELDTQLAKLALAIELELRLPEILVLQEVENQEILQTLGDLVNDAAGTSYIATSFETSDERGIEVGFLWDASRVDLVDAYQMSGPEVEAAFGPTSPSPGREPLVGVFNITGSIQDPPLTIIGNHFKSKSGDDPLYGVNQPPLRVTEEQRKAQARAVRNFVNGLLDANPQAWVMVTGDLNDFHFGEPGEGSDHPLAILAGSKGEKWLTNLVSFESLWDRFSYLYDGNSQVLDHMLVSPALLKLRAGEDFLHFNAGWPYVLRSDSSTPINSSDHDPLEGRFNVKKAKADYALTLLHSNDGESKLIDAGVGLEDFGSVARFATVVDDLRAEALDGSGKRGVVLLSTGDNYLAGPQLNASLEKGAPYYDTIAMKHIGYDVSAIGNHEFDFGPEVFAEFISGFEGAIKFLSANLDFSAEPVLQAFVDDKIIVKSLILHKGSEKVGLVGATTPLLPFISSPRNVTVDPDVAGTMQAQINLLQKKGVNKIIVISHLQNINEDLELALLLSGVDIMIAGGGDELLANEGDLLAPGDTVFGPYPLFTTGADGAKIPVVTTSGDYKYVGRLLAYFDKYGRLIAIDKSSGPVRVAGGDNPDAVTPDPFLQSEVVEPLQAYVDDLAVNVIGVSEVGLDGRRAPGVRTEETNLGNLMTDALFWQADQLAASFGVAPPDVGLQNGGGIRNNNVIPAGNITVLDTWNIAPFSNFVSLVPSVPREQFKEIMENAVSRTPGADGRFAQISGFKMVYDPAGTAQVLDADGNVVTPGSKVLEITLDDDTQIVSGGVVIPGPALSVATIDFLAKSGDQYPFRGAAFTTLGVTYQQALRNYIVDGLGGLISAADYPEGGEGRITP